MISKFIKFVKVNHRDLLLLFAIFLATLFSFSLGYIVAKMEEKEPLKFEQPVYKDEMLELDS